MIQRNLMRAGLSLAVTLAGLGLHAFATDQPPVLPALGEAAKSLDAELGERVDALLRRDPGLTGARLQVAVESGVVTLTGTVPDEQVRRRALELAAGARGAREARNGMELADPSR